MRMLNVNKEGFYKTLLDCLFDAVYTVDTRNRITYWNNSCQRITGYSADEVMGQDYHLFMFSEPDAGSGSDNSTTKTNSIGSPAKSGIEIVLKTGMPGTWKGYMRRKNGQRIPVESHISPIPDENGNIIGAIEVFRDISAHVALEDAHRQVLHLSRRDQLTGLYNRTATAEMLKAELERAVRYKQQLSVVMIDIDHFKRVNDTYGHDIGDKVLAKIGSILRYNVRQPDIVGRWGGEEFLLIAPGSDAHSAAQLAQRSREYIHQTKFDGIPKPITASFGVAQLDQQQSHDKLLYAADMALYQAKNSGRNKVVIANATNQLTQADIQVPRQARRNH